MILTIDAGSLRFREREDAPGDDMDYLVARGDTFFTEIVEETPSKGEALVRAGRDLYRLRWLPGANLQEFRDTCELELLKRG